MALPRDDGALLQRLVGEHPAAIRLVSWGAGTPECVELETKHGHVVVIERRTGRVHCEPPRPPEVPAHAPRRWQDLTDAARIAFEQRPRFAAITPLEGRAATGWRFSLDTGHHLDLLLDRLDPVLSTD